MKKMTSTKKDFNQGKSQYASVEQLENDTLNSLNLLLDGLSNRRIKY